MLSSHLISIFITWCRVSLHACILVESWLNSCVPNSWLLVCVLTYFTMLEVWFVFYWWYRGEMSRVTLRIAGVQLVLELSLSCQFTKVIVIIDFVCSLCTWHHTQHAHYLPEKKLFIRVKASFHSSLSVVLSHYLRDHVNHV